MLGLASTGGQKVSKIHFVQGNQDAHQMSDLDIGVSGIKFNDVQNLKNVLTVSGKLQCLPLNL